jgi:carboxyl-terminal processing protease
MESQTMKMSWIRAVCLLAIACLCAGCTTTRIPLTDIDIPMIYIPLPDVAFLKIPLLQRGEVDLHGKSWTEAFEAMHLRIVQEYPFTERRGVNWNELYAEYAPEIARAQEADDEAAYYMALRKYIYCIPDGNMRISEESDYRKQAVGGGYGLSMMALDDGRVIAHRVFKDSPVAQAGMRWGAEILEWNGKPIRTALRETPIIWAARPPATEEGRFLAQCRLLGRAPVGTEARISFRNENSETPWVAKLAAVEDGLITLKGDRFDPEKHTVMESPIQWKLLPGNYGYIRIFFEGPSWNTPFPTHVFKKAVSSFVEREVHGLILDVRENRGGDCTLPPQFLGHFFEDPRLYYDAMVFNPPTKSFEISKKARLIIEPADPYFEKPVIVLIDERTQHAGEGFPMALSSLPHVQILGFSGTHGSFGITGGDIAMPGGISLSYPVGRAVDLQGDILVDSGRDLQGGIAPDVRPARTRDLVYARFVENGDVLLGEALSLLYEAQEEKDPL